MTTVLIYKALLVTCCIRQVGSGISLTAYSSIEKTHINSSNVVVDIECNSNFSLVCEVKPYINSATWQINGENAALCISTSCFENLPFPEYHTFSMNTSSGEFIMSVSPVTNDTNGNIYKCDDGHTALSVIPVIKFLPTNETLKIDNSVETKITVSTGCVYPKNKTDMGFDWFISKNKVNPIEEESLSTISRMTTVNECTETNCAGLDTAYFNVTVEFEVYNEGESFYICVKITHIDAEKRPAVICSDKQFQVLKKSNPLTTIPNTSTLQRSNKPKENTLFGLDKILFIVACATVAGILIVIVVVCIHKHRRKSKQTGERGITFSNICVEGESRK